MDWIALASVVTSGLVAVSTVLANLVVERGRRRHESSLAYEGRAWDQKTDALFTVIRTSGGVLDTLRLGPRPASELVDLGCWALAELDEVYAPVEAYASQDTRTALRSVRSQLESLRANDVVVPMRRIERIRRRRREALDAGDVEAAAALGDEEKLGLEDLTLPGRRIDQTAFSLALETLVSAARDSLRGRD